MNVIHQNIAIALATKALFVGLTAFGMATMWGAIAADVGVSLLVVANALRLLRAKKDRPDGSGGEQVGEKMAQGALAHGH
jgi:Cd2+/Zn2+-exporting ATPase